jgi:hypothetical protein
MLISLFTDILITFEVWTRLPQYVRWIIIKEKIGICYKAGTQWFSVFWRNILPLYSQAIWHLEAVCSTIMLAPMHQITWCHDKEERQRSSITTKFYVIHYVTLGPGGSVVLLVGRSRDRSPVVSLGIFSEESDKSMCPGSTQPLKMSTRIFLGVKAASA